jgi:hypothetical protein
MDSRRHNLKLHKNVNQFYYMQSIQELMTLYEQFDEAQRNLKLISGRLDLKYTETFHQWRKDVRWIHRGQQCGE